MSRSLLAIALLAACGHPDGAATPSADWTAAVQARLDAEGRAIHPFEGAFAADVGPSLAVFADGVEVRDPAGAPVLGLHLDRWGRDGALADVPSAVPELGACTDDSDATGACIRRLEYDRGDVTEWWIGLGTGIEQGFDVAGAPAGQGPLAFEVRLEATSDVAADGFTDGEGTRWQVGGVSAMDAEQRALPVEVRAEGDTLVVLVDDTGAAYPIEVDPIYSTPSVTLSGSTDPRFATAFAGADVDGDGYDDAIVGAYYAASKAGRAYVFPGSSTGLSPRASGAIDGETNSGFAYAVSSAGDVNGDGYDDVVFGNSPSSTAYGKWWVYLGSSGGLTTTSEIEVEGTTTTYARAVGGGGDVNGDGYDDIVVGDSAASAAYVFYGSASGVTTASAVTLTGTASTEFGEAIDIAEDVNGDGYDEVLVGGSLYSSKRGIAALYAGASAGVPTTAAWSYTGTSTTTEAGNLVATAGDVNGDGYGDVVVAGVGSVYAFHGSASGLATTPNQTITSIVPLRFATPGDTNKDGYDDIGLGLQSSTNGIVRAYRGSATGVSTTTTTMRSVTGASGQSLGKYVAMLDANGDGYAEMLASSATPTWAGSAISFDGSSSGMSTTASTTLSYADAYYATYLRVWPAGDLDGDGYDDIAVSNYAYSSSTGIVHVYYGSASGTETWAGWSAIGGATGNAFGGAVAAGDLNGDGYDDLVIGAATYNTSTGRVYGYKGSASGIGTTATDTATGASTSKYGGYLAIADIDADGYEDVLVGASGTKTVGQIYGSKTDIFASTGTYLSSVALTSFAAADINGDGRADLVGSPGTPTNYLYLHYGGTGSTSWSSFTGDTTAEYFGYSYGLGDIDGDTCADLVVGAPGTTSSSAGHLYAFYGYASGLHSTADWTRTGAASAFLGANVRVADINDDGYADLVSDSSTATSRMELTYGASDGLADSAHATFSIEDATAVGDVDGDGFVDFADYDSSSVDIYFGYDADTDGDGTYDADDCEDDDATSYPGASELCDDVDNDCDGEVDEGAIDPATWYADADGDRYGTTAGTTEACDRPTGYAATSDDCDDAAPAVHPDAIESCDGVDEDCDGSIDEDSPTTPVRYLDADGDGYGTVAGGTVVSCSLPSGYAAYTGDCDDSDADVSPGATETCNGADDDCDGQTDENDASDAATWYRDADGDDYGTTATVVACSRPTGFAAASGDCDDGDSTLSPAATETCDDEDEDCDGSADDGLATATYYADADGDGFGDASVATTDCGAPSGYVSDATDCDDADATVDDGIAWYRDADGDREGDPSVTSTSCEAPSGYVAAATDCDDTIATVHSSATETCNGRDDDCDGTTDENDASDALTFYRDADEDGYGVASPTTKACAAPKGYATTTTDCDDAIAGVHPGASETCDGVDEDCDGAADDGVTVLTWYRDADADGFGSAATKLITCAVPVGYADNAADCDDADAELGDGVWWYADGDADGYGDGTTAAYECDAPSGYIEDDDDCDDADPAVRPDATEVWYDGVDQDCDGRSDADQDGDGFDGDGGPDCDDLASDVYPDAPETPYDGVDADCSGTSDDDADGDGHDDAAHGGDDCDDTNRHVYPGAPDRPYDGVITDCDATDELDADGDGMSATVDCDDTNADVHPGAAERWYDGIDQNCDGNDDDQDEDGVGVVGDCDDGDPSVGPCAVEPKGCATSPAGGWMAAVIALLLARRAR